MTPSSRWVERWHDLIDPEPEAPGVYRRKDGGFHVRGRVTDPRTGKLREVNRAMPEIRKVREASAFLAAELAKVTEAAHEVLAIPRFKDYAATVFERRVADGTILSAKGREKWASVLKAHLLPAFGDHFLDKITTADIEAWKARVSPAKSGYKPATVNSVMGVLRVILGCAAEEFQIRDPIARVKPFDNRGHRTYTDEAPNSLAPKDVPRFLAKLRELFPQHYAFTVLGFATGLRPSSLRPIRRRGASADMKWDDRMLLIRRSHTRKDEIMEATKTDRDQRIHLPRDLVAILEEHVANLPPGPMRDSDLLFPSEIGGYRAGSCLDRPFDKVAKEIELGYPLSPRCMRRTFQDLAREAGVANVVTRAISGHATASMQEHYSTARQHEVTAGLAKIIDLARVRETLVTPKPARRQRRRKVAIAS